MQDLLAVIVAWLSINFGLPAVDAYPNVAFVPTAKMAEIRYGRSLSEGPDPLATESGSPSRPEFGEALYAIYDEPSRTIYLPEGWEGSSPREVSLLVHELVHHLQDVAGLKFDCPAAREKLAYQAQAGWLELFGTTLVDEFEIDTMTILVRTNCMY